jgi:hypothetical protein
MAEVNQTVTTPAAGPAPSSAAAPSLLSKIKSNLQAISQPVGLGTAMDQTAAIQQVSRASTGKLIGPETGPARSRQGVLTTTDTIQQAQKTLADKAQMQTLGQVQKMEAIQADEQFKNTMMSEEQLTAREKMLNIKKDILTEFTNNSRQLDLAKDKARLEQLGFAARLSNDKYLNQLQNQARISNLGDELSFQEELMRSTFAEEESMFRDSMEFRSLMQADEREFRENLASMSLEFARDMANTQNETMRRQAAWSGIASIISAGLGKTAQKKWDEAAGGWSTFGMAQGAQPSTMKWADTGGSTGGPSPMYLPPVPLQTSTGYFPESGEALDFAGRR